MAVALRLRQAGHRVRIATHGPLRTFVERFGLEFFDIGGDPAVLAEFAVQSKGMLLWTNYDAHSRFRLELNANLHVFCNYPLCSL